MGIHPYQMERYTPKETRALLLYYEDLIRKLRDAQRG